MRQSSVRGCHFTFVFIGFIKVFWNVRRFPPPSSRSTNCVTLVPKPGKEEGTPLPLCHLRQVRHLRRSSTHSRDSIRSTIKHCWTWGRIRSIGSGPSSSRSRRTVSCSGAGWTGRFGRREYHRPQPCPPTCRWTRTTSSSGLAWTPNNIVSASDCWSWGRETGRRLVDTDCFMNLEKSWKLHILKSLAFVNRASGQTLFCDFELLNKATRVSLRQPCLLPSLPWTVSQPFYT